MMIVIVEIEVDKMKIETERKIITVVLILAICFVSWVILTVKPPQEIEYNGTITGKWTYERNGYSIFVLEINGGFTMHTDHKTWNQTEIGDTITFTMSEVEN